MGRKNNRKRERVPRISNNLLVHPRRMEIWYASLPMDRRTSVQGGSRPVVIVSNDICNENSPAVIGVAEPVGVNVETFGTEHRPITEIEAFARSNYDLTPKGIIKALRLLDVDYNEVSAYGHFGKRELPWEE